MEQGSIRALFGVTFSQEMYLPLHKIYAFHQVSTSKCETTGEKLQIFPYLLKTFLKESSERFRRF